MLRPDIQLTGTRGTNVTVTFTKDWAGVGSISSKEFALYSNIICKVDDRWVFNAPRFGSEVKQKTRYIYLGLINFYYDLQPKPPQKRDCWGLQRS